MKLQKACLPIATLLFLAGCRGAMAPATDMSLATVTALGAGTVALNPAVTKAVPRDGMANVRVELKVGAPKLGFSLKALPTAWTGADVSLHSATANGAYDPTHHRRSAEFGAFANYTPPIAYSHNTRIDALANPAIAQAINMKLDPSGNLWVAAAGPYHVVKIAPNGTSTAVRPGDAPIGTEDYDTTDFVWDAAGNMYIPNNTTIRKITPGGDVSDFGAIAGGYNLMGLAIHPITGDIYGSEFVNSKMRKVNPTTGVATDVTADFPGMNTVCAMDFAPDGTLYICEYFSHRVRRRLPNGTVEVINGGFGDPTTVKCDAQGNAFVCSRNTNQIKRIDHATGAVTNLFADATPPLTTPHAATVDPSGQVVWVQQGGQIRTFRMDGGAGGTGTPGEGDEPGMRATFDFPPLRPAADYTARVYLKNEAGAVVSPRLAGSQVLSGITLNAGANRISFDVDLNGDEATYSLDTSANGNVVSGNNLTKDDEVTMSTGLAANQPGVSSLKVFISGAAYGNPATPVLIDTLSNPAAWSSFTWDTGAATGGYLPASLAGGTGTGTKDGQLDFVAYNDRGEEVGKASLAIHVFGRPTVQVHLQ